MLLTSAFGALALGLAGFGLFGAAVVRGGAAHARVRAAHGARRAAIARAEGVRPRRAVAGAVRRGSSACRSRSPRAGWRRRSCSASARTTACHCSRPPSCSRPSASVPACSQRCAPPASIRWSRSDRNSAPIADASDNCTPFADAAA